MTGKKRILLALGSPNDGKRLLGDKRLAEIIDSERFNNVKLYLSIASAHRTPETVCEHAFGIEVKRIAELAEMPIEKMARWLIQSVDIHKELARIGKENVSERYNVVIAGAGLANGLVSAHKAYAHRDTIVIGLPIFDSATQGLTSLLSTQEMPPGCPVGCVGVDRIDAAVDMALDLATKSYKKIIIVKEPSLINEDVDFTKANNEKEISKCIEKLKTLDIENEVSVNDLNSIEKDAIAIFPYNNILLNTQERKFELVYIKMLDEVNKKNPGITIAGYCGEINQVFLSTYNGDIKTLERTMHVRFGGIENMAILAARIVANTTGNEDIKQKLNEEFEKGLTKYEQWKKPVRIKSAAHLSDAVVECSESR